LGKPDIIRFSVLWLWLGFEPCNPIIVFAKKKKALSSSLFLSSVNKGGLGNFVAAYSSLLSCVPSAHRPQFRVKRGLVKS